MRIWGPMLLFVALAIALIDSAPADLLQERDTDVVVSPDNSDSTIIPTLRNSSPASETSPNHSRKDKVNRRKNGKKGRRAKNKERKERRLKKRGNRKSKNRKNKVKRKANRRNRRKGKRCAKDSDCKQGKICLIKKKKLTRLRNSHKLKLLGKCRRPDSFNTSVFQKINS